MRWNKVLLCAVLLAAVSLALAAEEAKKPEDAKRETSATPSSNNRRRYEEADEDIHDLRRLERREKRSAEARHEKQFKAGDTNNDGVLTVDEYRALYRKPLEKLEQSESMKKAIDASDRMRGEIFERLDKDKNGVLAKGEWERVYSASPSKREESDLHDMMEEEEEMRGPGRVHERLRKEGRMLHLLHTDDLRNTAFAEADADKNKAISLEELQKYMAKPHEDMEKEQAESKMRRDAQRKTAHTERKEEQRKKMSEDMDTPEAAKDLDMKAEVDEHTKRMDKARSDFDAKFEARKKEIDARMSEAKARINSLRSRQVERTFKHYDSDRDGKITAEEWHAAIKRSSLARSDFGDEPAAQALRKETQGTGAASF